MNIYTLKDKELRKLHNEFNKTAFGKRAKVFSMLPAFSLIITIVEDLVNNGGTLYTCFILLNLALLGVTQLIYGNMLKDYINSKKDN